MTNVSQLRRDKVTNLEEKKKTKRATPSNKTTHPFMAKDRYLFHYHSSPSFCSAPSTHYYRGRPTKKDLKEKEDENKTS